ncbi:MAG: type II toxin-antitoxin system RelE/ParE family toxin [Oligoflexales bacterium]|nr:type II toxin-antitoxin system RelE/ParE family toxin [Oligoflexales bacterium]
MGTLEDCRRVASHEIESHFHGLKTKAFELRDRDKEGCYRVLYVTFVKGKIHVLHSFKKKSSSTSKKDKALAN